MIVSGWALKYLIRAGKGASVPTHRRLSVQFDAKPAAVTHVTDTDHDIPRIVSYDTPGRDGS
jgi:hypothetical protein